jgi:hypothetical protein
MVLEQGQPKAAAKRHGQSVPVPMAFRVFVEGREHDRQYSLYIVAYQITEIFVVPEVECSLGHLTLKSAHVHRVVSPNAHLKMRAGHGFCQLVEERLLHFGKFCWVHHFKYIFNFVQKHDLFCAVDLWPVPQKPQNYLENVVSRDFDWESVGQTYLFGQCRVLLQKLHNAVCQLWMVHAQAFDFMHRNQDSCEEQLMLFLERQRETVDDRSKNLEQLCDAIESFRLVNELEEHIVYRASDVGT